MNNFEHPWQITASLLIIHAKEHAQKSTDFDKQMAYLLVDIGVETMFKAYLAQTAYKDYRKLQIEAKNNSRELNFHQLNSLVIQKAGETLHEIKINEADYFHDKRNQIYHQGDGVAPTGENLNRYLELSHKLLLVLLDIDLTDIEPETEKNKYMISVEGRNRNIDSLAGELKDRINFLHKNCAILTEHLHPKYSTLKLAIKLQSIWETIGGDASIDNDNDIRNDEIVRLFNKFTGMHSSDRYFVNFLIEDPSRLHVWVALQDMSESFEDDWDIYQKISVRMNWLQYSWKQEIDNNQLDPDAIFGEYKMIESWISLIEEKIDKRLQEIYPDVQRPKPPRYLGF